jgi:deoxyadenosine/deoxycytidine kinase
MKIYSVEGNIGSGKSTLLQKLKEYYSDNELIVFLQEPVDDWNDIVDINGKNILSKYYSDQSRYAFSFQMLAFITRLKQISDVIEHYKNTSAIIITERCIYTDREIFAKMLFDSKKIEYIEYTIYLKWFDYFIKDIKINGIIYLRTFPEECMNRIKQRNREGENIEIEYLYNLHDYHHQWLISGARNINNNILLLDGEYSFEYSRKQIDNFVLKKSNVLIEPNDVSDSDNSDILINHNKTLQFEKIEIIFYYFLIPLFNIFLISLPFVYPYLPNYLTAKHSFQTIN